MKIKWQHVILVVLLTLFGTLVEHNSPNQQIVVEFADKHISLQEAEVTVENIQQQLQTIGATDISISYDKKGSLKITYYIDTEIERIQNVLSKDRSIAIAAESGEDNDPDSPDDKNQKKYKLNISEIHKTNNSNWDFEGTQVVELNHKSDRYNRVKLNSFGDYEFIRYFNHLQELSLITSTTTRLKLQSIPYAIPEVRAGPLT